MTGEVPPKARAKARNAVVALDHAEEATAIEDARQRYEDARERIDEALDTLDNFSERD